MATTAPPPLTVHVTVKIDPSKLPEFYAALHPIHAKLAQEEKCLYMNVFEILGQPGVVRMVEIWDCDVEYMGTVQAKKEYYLPFFETVGKIALEPQTVEILNSVEGYRYMKA